MYIRRYSLITHTHIHLCVETQWGDPRYLAWAEDAADVVWARGLLRKGNGLCHGVSGNAYCACCSLVFVFCVSKNRSTDITPPHTPVLSHYQDLPLPLLTNNKQQ